MKTKTRQVGAIIAIAVFSIIAMLGMLYMFF